MVKGLILLNSAETISEVTEWDSFAVRQSIEISEMLDGKMMLFNPIKNREELSKDDFQFPYLMEDGSVNKVALQSIKSAITTKFDQGISSNPFNGQSKEEYVLQLKELLPSLNVLLQSADIEIIDEKDVKQLQVKKVTLEKKIELNVKKFDEDKMYLLNAEEDKVYGRLNIQYVIHVIHDDMVETNKNGLNWQEEYVSANIAGAKNMPIRVNFDWDGIKPTGHGYFITDSDGDIISEGSLIVGANTDAYIKTISVNGVDRKVLMGEGYVDKIAYKNFCMWLENRFFKQMAIDTSVEIAIEKYEIETDKLKIPEIYSYIGDSILSVEPADNYAIITELSQAQKKKEELENMDLEQLKRDHEIAINAKDDEIKRLQDEHGIAINAKETEITDLGTTHEDALKLINDAKEVVVSELKVFQDAKLVADFKLNTKGVDEAILTACKESIDAFNATPTKEGLEVITNSVNAEIVKALRSGDKKVITNSAKDIKLELHADEDKNLVKKVKDKE